MTELDSLSIELTRVYVKLRKYQSVLLSQSPRKSRYLLERMCFALRAVDNLCTAIGEEIKRDERNDTG